MLHEKQFCLLETQAARKKKSDPPVLLLKQHFPKNNNPAPKAKIPVRSDPIQSGVRSDPKSDPIRNPIRVLLTAPIEFLSEKHDQRNPDDIKADELNECLCEFYP